VKEASKRLSKLVTQVYIVVNSRVVDDDPYLVFELSLVHLVLLGSGQTVVILVLDL